jgi:hypothetical protein
LANFLQAVRFWLLLAVASNIAAAAPFSHRVHLTKKLPCTVCHADAPKSTKANDSLLPNPKVCAGCHSDSRQVKAPRALTVSKFNHQFHAKFGSIGPIIGKALQSGAYLGRKTDVHAPDLNTKNACAACHRGLERSDEVSLAVFPKMADCLVCHNQVDPPFSCEKCHDANANLKPATHTNEWLERHSSKATPKDKESCAVCHGRQFTCLGCH